MSCEAIIRVLLVGGEPQECFVSRRLFERNSCQCHFAKSEEEVAELLIAREFDIVLSAHRISGGIRSARRFVARFTRELVLLAAC